MIYLEQPYLINPKSDFELDITQIVDEFGNQLDLSTVQFECMFFVKGSRQWFAFDVVDYTYLVSFDGVNRVNNFFEDGKLVFTFNGSCFCEGELQYKIHLTLPDERFGDRERNIKHKGILPVVINSVASAYLYKNQSTSNYTRLEITTPPTKLEYNEGENFNPEGMVVNAIYLDGTTKTISNYVVLNGDNLQSNTTFITVSYTEEGTTKTAQQAITVNAVEILLESIEITTPPTKLEYFANESIDITGMVVRGAFSDSSTRVLTSSEISINPIISSSETIQVTGIVNSVSHTDVFDITIVSKLIDIELESEPTKTTYAVGENFNPEGMVVNAIYDNNPSQGVPVTNYTIIGGNNLQLGTDEVIISYTERGITKTYPLAITVQEVVVPKTLICGFYDTSYNEGEVFDITTLTGLQIVYSDGERKSITYTSLSGYSPDTPLNIDDEQVIIYYTEDGVTIQTSLPIRVSAAVQYPTLTNPSLVVNTMHSDKGSALATYNNNIENGVEIEIDITLNKGTINPDYSLTPPVVSDRIGEVDLASATLEPRNMTSGLNFVGVEVRELYATAILEQYSSSESNWNVPLDCTLRIPYGAGKQPVDSAGNNYQTPYPNGTLEAYNQGIDFAIAGVFANSSNITTPTLLAVEYHELTFDADEFLIGIQLEREFTSFETSTNKYELHLNSQLEITNVEIWDSFDEIWLPLSSYTFAVVGGEEGVAPNSRIWRSTAPRNTNGALYRFTITEI